MHTHNNASRNKAESKSKTRCMLQAVQMLFEQSQASFDPNAVMAVLEEHPYHVDALLTMHELYRYAPCRLCCVSSLLANS